VTGSQRRPESVSEILRAAAGLGPREPAAGRDADPGDPQVLTKRLRRIVRQLETLERLVEQQAAITDVLSQITTVSRGLRVVAVGLLTDHVRQCMDDSVRTDPQVLDAKLREATTAIAAFVGS